MVAQFWQFGGPHMFAQRVADSLREGCNIVLRLPEHMPAGLASAVRRALGDSQVWRWRTWHLDQQPCKSLCTLLAQRFCPELPAWSGLMPQRLLEHPGFGGNIVWLEGITSDVWQEWRSFLEAYSHACKSYSVIDRTLVCLVLQGACASLPLTTDVCLVEHRWYGFVRSVDMLVYCTGLLQETETKLHSRLSVSIAVHLALWDPLLATRLLEADLAMLLQPEELLRNLAQERGWAHSTLQRERYWCLGAADRIDGDERVHSAALAVLNNHHEIKHRLWKAEMTVLYPMIEERRMAMINRLRNKLRPAHGAKTPGDGDLYALEWRDILERLKTSTGREPCVALAEAKLLRDIRNTLAHQRLLEKSQLQGLLKLGL